MSRINYLFRLLVVTVVQLALLTWYFAPYNSIGIAEHLPARTGFRMIAGFLVILASGAWMKSAASPAYSPSAPLSRRTFILLKTLLFFPAALALIRLTGPLISTHIPIIGAKMPLGAYAFWVGLLYASGAAMRILPLFTRSILPTVDEVLADDPRKPVLYFRSFEKEIARSGFAGILLPYLDKARGREGVYIFSTRAGGTSYGGRTRARNMAGTSRSRFDEQMVFADAFNEIGPYIALGRPAENFRDMDLGAAKKYVENHEWQDAVCDWLRKCAAVVIEAADSASLGWEISRVVEIFRPTAVLVICPLTEKNYQEFVRTHGRLFPKSLPASKPKSRLLTFSENWKPQELPNVNLNAAVTLQPFFEQVRLLRQSVLR